MPESLPICNRMAENKIATNGTSHHASASPTRLSRHHVGDRQEGGFTVRSDLRELPVIDSLHFAITSCVLVLSSVSSGWFARGSSARRGSSIPASARRITFRHARHWCFGGTSSCYDLGLSHAEVQLHGHAADYCCADAALLWLCDERTGLGDALAERRHGVR